MVVVVEVVHVHLEKIVLAHLVVMVEKGVITMEVPVEQEMDLADQMEAVGQIVIEMEEKEQMGQMELMVQMLQLLHLQMQIRIPIMCYQMVNLPQG